VWDIAARDELFDVARSVEHAERAVTRPDQITG
jgi:hypothetical protein